MKIVGMIRCKNEARWIERCLASILPLCDQIVVLDDHSDDDTLARCQAMPKTYAFESPFEGGLRGMFSFVWFDVFQRTSTCNLETL